MNLKPQAVLGLFPYFGPGSLGGVQSSARIAWKTVTNFLDDRATLMSYGARLPTMQGSDDGVTLIASSKVEAIGKALSRTWPQDLVFVWHMSLLNLIPFFRFSRVRIVLMLLGIEAWKEQSWFMRRQIEKVDLFLSISDHTWQKFLEYNPNCADKPHQTVLLGIESPLVDEIPEPGEVPVTLMLSRLAKSENYKGHSEVINAWPLVLREMPEAELWIAGEGDLRPDLERLVEKLGLAKRVRFWGEVSDQTKKELLRRCRCLAMPSRSEGFGLVYLEAMRVGRPCLVSNLDAAREVVNPPEAGLAVDLSDTDDIATALVRLLSKSGDWTNWSVQARRRYEQNFTAKKYEERLLSALFSAPPDALLES